MFDENLFFKAEVGRLKPVRVFVSSLFFFFFLGVESLQWAYVLCQVQFALQSATFLK